jgi:hypothetical protein
VPHQAFQNGIALDLKNRKPRISDDLGLAATLAGNCE